jgi:SAM-dependent methyltransferase
VTSFDPSSRTKLTRRDRERFPDGSLFHAVGRTLCDAECLPRKELFEAWEVARRVRRRFRGGRVLDLACGHGLLSYLLLLLDDTSPEAVAIDVRFPDSAAKLEEAMVQAWPRLAGRISRRVCAIEDVEVAASDLVVSVHACGPLTDDVLRRAVSGGARVAVLPCCQDAKVSDLGGLAGWLDAPLAIDVERVHRLRAKGYAVRAESIPAVITPKNRLILAEPAGQ